MKLIRWEPFGNAMRTSDPLSRMFDDPFFRFFKEEGNVWSPVVDLFNEEDRVLVKAEMPGIDKKELDIRVENNVLTITGEKKREKEIKDKNAYRMERCYGKFSRSFSLPAPVDGEKVKANYKDGILEIDLPKIEEVKPRKIKIN
jgi:HSP20 family protein